MATIRFNNSYLQTATVTGSSFATGGPLVSSSGVSFYTTQLSGGSNGDTQLVIYKGSVPSFPTFTDASTRSADVLITFSLQGLTSSYAITTTANSFRLQLGVNTVPQAASAAGTATWFLLRRAGTSSLTDKGAMIGTIGATGSGADLELASTSITIGPLYSSNGIFINFPFERIF